jgi:hypothetical protein
MWRFLIGLSTGIYIGTNYDCKPLINKITSEIKKYIPDKKN